MSNNFSFILKGVNKLENFNKSKIEITNKENMLESLEKAAIIHKKVRSDIQSMIQPGLKLSNLERAVTKRIKHYTNNNGINGGIAFPPSLSISNCVAHFTPYKSLDKTLNINDNIKIDIGVHVNGWMIDSAFTCYFDPNLDILHQAAKEATNHGCKTIAKEMYINDWSSEINEIIESYEINYMKQLYTIKNIKGVSGHNILQNTIHGGKMVPAYKILDNFGKRFNEGIYAVEPFCSIISDKIINNYQETTNFKLSKNNNNIFSNNIFDKFNNYIFTRKHIDDYSLENSFNNIKTKLVKYPSIYSSNKNDLSAQYEHTVYLYDKKIILSKDKDY
jgi:methionyl aminopeptidase